MFQIPIYRTEKAPRSGRPVLCRLAAAAVVIVAVVPGAAVAAATAVAEQQDQNDDPPPVVVTEAATVVVTHKEYLQKNFFEAVNRSHSMVFRSPKNVQPHREDKLGFECWMHWRGSAYTFPRGEGGFLIAHTWAIKKTEEERRQNRHNSQKR